MVKENFVFTRSTNGIDRRYYYKLIQNILNDEYVYGIEIERKDYKGDLELDSFSDSVEYISPDREKVRGLLVNLYDHQVSPIHLIDIAGEFIDNCVGDLESIGI